MFINYLSTRVFKLGLRRQCCTKPVAFKCKLLIVGAGTGGCSVAWRLAAQLKDQCVIVLEPSKLHYYQPGFTLVGSGLKKLSRCHKPTHAIIPPSVVWLRDSAEQFDPSKSLVHTKNGVEVNYDFMVVAIGINNNYDEITGLKAALDNPDSKVSTIYSPDYCKKTWRNIKEFKGGHALFTYPPTGGKCAGAALKIMYLAHDYWRKHKVLKNTNITYNSGGKEIFCVPKYARALTQLTSERDIAANFNTNLVEVRPHEALFVGKDKEIISLPYNMLHVSPSMSPPVCLTSCAELRNDCGFLDVDHRTLQHTKFPNVFGLGDCTCTPNTKTAAAVAPQSHVVAENLSSVMSGREPTKHYNGYGACQLLTSYRAGIIAEFLYDRKVCETFPFDQSIERGIFFPLSTYFMPHLYWEWLLKGKWNGPAKLRRYINPFAK